jgi:hypothetical protein
MFRATLVAALLVAFGVRADAPKADLSDLKDAVRAADKRGANVEPVKAALAALEKALAKGATETAPPELAALRDAVEAAVKKGEKVEGISDELGAVEKALTGKAFERPKGPEQKLAPEPEFPNPRFQPGFPNRRVGGGGIVINGGGRVVIGGGAGNFNSTAVTISNGTFTIRAKRGEVFYVVTGTPDGKTKIEITDGDTKTDTDDAAKVPEKHKAAVEQLLKMVNRN